LQIPLRTCRHGAALLGFGLGKSRVAGRKRVLLLLPDLAKALRPVEQKITPLGKKSLVARNPSEKGIF